MQKRVRRDDAVRDGDEGDGSGGEERDGEATASTSEKYAGVKVKVRRWHRSLLKSIGKHSLLVSVQQQFSRAGRPEGVDFSTFAACVSALTAAETRWLVVEHPLAH